MPTDRLDEQTLLERLAKIEALHAGTTFDGERAAAENARQRILALVERARAEAPPIEFQFRMDDDWSRRLFLALLRRYGLRPYRYRRQRYTTVMVRAPEAFVERTLWPEFQQLSAVLRQYLSEVTDRVIADVLQQKPDEDADEDKGTE
jgi:hypothetical protein